MPSRFPFTATDPGVHLMPTEGPIATKRNFEELYEVRIPTIKIICPTCNGNGKHVNPSIDGNGISASDECWQDEGFEEDYFQGRYDVTCHECNGRNVVDEIDAVACPAELLAQWMDYCNGIAEDRAIQSQEQRMGM